MFSAFDPALLWTIAGPAFVAGIVGGTLAGLLGIGGGIVIVPALYFALALTDMDPAQIMQVAVGTSLATIVFTSLSSAWGHYRKDAIDFAILKLWGPAILVGVILGGIIGGLISGYVLIGVFAVVALIVGGDMILRRTRTLDTPRSYSKPVWAVFGVFAGGISAMMGIGGGSVCVPMLSFLGYDIRRAVGTSAAIGFIIGLPGAITYMATGFGNPGLPPLSLGYVNLLAAALIIPLSVVFARVGVWLAHKIPPRWLRLAFGVFLIVTALRMGADLFTA